MFFYGYDLYVAGPVLGAAVQSNFSTLGQNGWFLSLTFVGMTLGSLLAGFSRRSLRPTLYLSIQSDDFRARLARCLSSGFCWSSASMF
jgi:MFS family permease